MSPKTASHLLHEVHDQRVCPEHDFNTCLSTRAPTGDRQTTKSSLVWTLDQERLSVQDCSPLQARGRSTSRPSEEKLEGLCYRVDFPYHV
ncbi:hypothetical protein DPMN_113187 [Dreissena polymorpha]|uniref:Uncharacterized protein n=1 Tax=Dreissena polymorpha TaxID=45954 RepID=A0A9D4KH39_DREPO|nr:hypothetical protein DPMN_113187 [Dreissena polymorpha]